MSPGNETPTHTALGDVFRGEALRRRELAAAHPDDPRHLRNAEALDELAVTADREIHARGYYACHLLRHHLDDGHFAWPGGQAERAVSNFGVDSPIDGPEAYEAFLGDLCDLATWDACHYIADHEGDFDRREAKAIAERYGVSADRVHAALDGVRYEHLFQVGIPHWHELSDETRQALEGLDGTWVEPPATDGERPTYVNNVGAGTGREAREIVGQLAGIDPDALGVGIYPRIFPPATPGPGG